MYNSYLNINSKYLCENISQIIKELPKGLTLYDIKLEFGRDAKTGEILLIDEISGGNMRAYKGDTYIEPLELEKIMLD